jgi:hypothetical protein
VPPSASDRRGPRNGQLTDAEQARSGWSNFVPQPRSSPLPMLIPGVITAGNGSHRAPLLYRIFYVTTVAKDAGQCSQSKEGQHRTELRCVDAEFYRGPQQKVKTRTRLRPPLFHVKVDTAELGWGSTMAPTTWSGSDLVLPK